MKVDLETTGERVIEDAYLQSLGAYTIYAMHAASYKFVEEICRGKRVLDFGCGSGYGTYRISALAREIHGVDVAADAVLYAASRYKADNLYYRHVSADSPLPYEDGKFDVILSFQVIEHIDDDYAYLREARRLLRVGGVLVVITPDRQLRLLPKQKPWNRWHRREYSMIQLVERIGRHYRISDELRMGAEWNVARSEINRYRYTKWLTLPVTLPWVPESIRRGLLNFIHGLIARRHRRMDSARMEPKVYGFDETDFIISKQPPFPMNLIVIASKQDR